METPRYLPHRARWFAPLLIVAALGVQAPVSHATTEVTGSIAVGPTIAFGCYYDSSCTAFIATCRPVFARQNGVTVSVVNLAELPPGASTYSASGDDMDANAPGASWIAFKDARCEPLRGGIDEPGVRLGVHAPVTVPNEATWAIVGARSARNIRWTLSPA
jgi:hypothetical protein